MNIFTLLLTILVVGLFVGILAYVIRIVPQSNAYVVERLGAIIQRGIPVFIFCFRL